MRIVFTTNNIIGSRIIRWFTQEPVSHIAFVFDNKVVIHSSLFGVELLWFKTFQEHSDIKYSHEIILPLEQEEMVWQSLLDAHDDVKYDYLAILYFGYRIALKRLFNIEMPYTNMWQSPLNDMCVELYSRIRRHVSTMPDIGDTSMLTPYKVWRALVDKTKET